MSDRHKEKVRYEKEVRKWREERKLQKVMEKGKEKMENKRHEER